MKRVLLALTIVCLSIAGEANAELHKINVALQYGFQYLPLVVMHHYKLIEKHAKAIGVTGLTVNWAKLGSGGAMTDALLSGNLQIASGGFPSLALLWAKTDGGVKGIGAMHAMPFFLNTRDPGVKTIKDFTSADRIALPAIKISTEAMLLEMAAAQAFGEANYAKLDPLTVSMKHPDAMISLVSGSAGITAHFAVPPFQYMELAHQGIHTVTTSFDIMGGPFTSSVIWTTTKFHDENPKVFSAIFAAYQESFKIIKRDKKAAAKVYVETTKSKESVEDIYKLLMKPEVKYTETPRNTMKFVHFMYKHGLIKKEPASWKDLFFPEIHGVAGS